MKGRIPELDVKLSIALIILALALVGYMQFTWFTRSAALEVEAARRSLTGTVMQAMSREFQRYASLVEDLRSVEPGGEDKVEGASGLKRFLAREYGLYGPTGSVPALLAAVGYVDGEAGATATLLSSSSPQWMDAANPLPEAVRLPPPSTGILAAGPVAIVTTDRGGTRQFLLAPVAGSRIAYVELDIEGFFDGYIKPAVLAVLPESSVSWPATAMAVDNDRQERQEPALPSFNPFRALLGGGSKVFLVSVPASIDFLVSRGQEHPSIFHSVVRLGGDSASNRKYEVKVARIAMAPGSAIASMERRLSLNWLFGNLLLVGLGIAFAQVVVQKHKLGVVTKREREFVASVTHELRTPVTAIRSAADNMRRGLVGLERMAPYGEMIHAQSLRLGSMIEEVLLFSQVEDKASQPPLLSAIDAPALAGELRSPLDAIAKSEGMRVDWDFGSLPRSFLCDAEALRLILSNLVANALYHAYPDPTREAACVVRVIGKARLPDSIEFFIEDDGRGIAKAEAALVFEAFYRDERSRARQEKGSGLGLFIARRKARLLGGDLVLESPYDHGDGARRPGCRFTLTLPLKGAGVAR